MLNFMRLVFLSDVVHACAVGAVARRFREVRLSERAKRIADFCSGFLSPRAGLCHLRAELVQAGAA